MRRTILCVLLASPWVSDQGCGQARAAVEYTLTTVAQNLGPYGQAFDLNDQGVVVGEVYIGNQQRAYVYQNGIATLIAGLPHPQSTAYGISNAGQIVGSYGNSTSGTQAFSYQNGIVTTLESLTGIAGAQAYAVNESGQAAGTSVHPGGGPWCPVLFGNSDTVTPFMGPVLGGANDLNDSGQCVGGFQAANGNNHAFLYNGSATIDLGTFGGAVSEALAINNAGAAVGYAADATGQDRAFLYQNNTLINIGLSSAQNSRAYDINDAGVIVGSMGFSAMIYEDGLLTDLASLVNLTGGWQELWTAQAINNNGQIVGVGMRNNLPTSFLLTPIPSPSVLASFIVLSVLNTSGRRRTSKPS